jgi:hypothetical protein
MRIGQAIAALLWIIILTSKTLVLFLYVTRARLKSSIPVPRSCGTAIVVAFHSGINFDTLAIMLLMELRNSSASHLVACLEMAEIMKSTSRTTRLLNHHTCSHLKVQEY